MRETNEGLASAASYPAGNPADADTTWVIWSHVHKAWRADLGVYVTRLMRAELYDEERAKRIANPPAYESNPHLEAMTWRDACAFAEREARRHPKELSGADATISFATTTPARGLRSWAATLAEASPLTIYAENGAEQNGIRLCDHATVSLDAAKLRGFAARLAREADALDGAAASSSDGWHCTDCGELVEREGDERCQRCAASSGERVTDEDVKRLADYATELENTVAGGGQFFAPRQSEKFAAALRRVLNAGTQSSGRAPSSALKLDRYNVYRDGQMEEVQDGEWVRYEDVLVLLRAEGEDARPSPAVPGTETEDATTLRGLAALLDDWSYRDENAGSLLREIADRIPMRSAQRDATTNTSRVPGSEEAADLEVSPEACRDTILVAGFADGWDDDRLLDLTASWTPRQRELVADYCMAVHLRASDNEDVTIPPRPAMLDVFDAGTPLSGPSEKAGQA